MPESLHQSSDTPNFDTYPANPPEGQTSHAGVEHASAERTALEQHAAELGAAAGKVVVMMRQTKENLENLTQHALYDRVSDLAESTIARAEHLRDLAEVRIQELTQFAQDRAAELSRQAREKTADMARQAKSGYDGARRRARQTVHDYPVHVAVAAGIIGFAIGMGLRIRRANRAYR